MENTNNNSINPVVNIDEYEASRIYGPSVHWFRRARWEGNGPEYIKLMGRVLYPIAKLDQFFASRLRRSTSEHSASSSK